MQQFIHNLLTLGLRLLKQITKLWYVHIYVDMDTHEHYRKFQSIPMFL